jgi:hypothetical protein
MNPIVVSLIVFACVFGGALFGMLLRVALPQHHLSADSKDVVKLGMGLVATMAALVLGLLVASAKSSYDAQSGALTDMSSKVVLLDRVLAHYGPETKDVRNLLRGIIADVLDRTWPKGRASSSQLEAPSGSGEILIDKIEDLSPQDDRHRVLQAQALSIVMGLGQTRWLQFAQSTTSISMPLLVMVVFWLATLFLGFGLFAPPNGTVVSSLFLTALSVSGAILLILEMYTPYGDLIQISGAPLRAALTQLGK